MDALKWMEQYEREQRESRDMLWSAQARCRIGLHSGLKPVEEKCISELRKLFADGKWRTTLEVAEVINRTPTTALKILRRLGAKSRPRGRCIGGMEWFLDA